MLKVGLSPSKKVAFIFFNKSSLKMMKNAFYFMLKALFVLVIFTLLSRLYDVTDWATEIIAIYGVEHLLLPYINFFKKAERGLELLSLPHFLNNF